MPLQLKGCSFFMNHIEVFFKDISSEISEMLVAVLDAEGYTGFEEKGRSLRAYIMEENFNRERIDEIATQYSIAFTDKSISEQNWNSVWESDFKPVAVFAPGPDDAFAYIRADFHEPDDRFKYDLPVTPKMSFGTGHHPTTYLMVAAMSTINFENQTVIDYGTGTGVLAILAEKLGASDIVAIDCDEWSIINTKENIEANNCKNITVAKSFVIDEKYKADIILANINLNILLANMNDIRNASKGRVLCSGILEHDESALTAGLIQAGFLIESINKREKWICILATLLH